MDPPGPRPRPLGLFARALARRGVAVVAEAAAAEAEDRDRGGADGAGGGAAKAGKPPAPRAGPGGAGRRGNWGLYVAVLAVTGLAVQVSVARAAEGLRPPRAAGLARWARPTDRTAAQARRAAEVEAWLGGRGTLVRTPYLSRKKRKDPAGCRCLGDRFGEQCTGRVNATARYLPGAGEALAACPETMEVGDYGAVSHSSWTRDFPRNPSSAKLRRNPPAAFLRGETPAVRRLTAETQVFTAELADKVYRADAAPRLQHALRWFARPAACHHGYTVTAYQVRGCHSVCNSRPTELAAD